MNPSSGRIVASLAQYLLILSTFLLVLAGAGCSSGSLQNGLVSCNADSDCPSAYHCAADDKCWQNGQGPVATTDGSVLPQGDGSTCSGSLASCNGACVSLGNDNANCGGCGNTCTGGTACAGGKCGTTCGGGQTMCGVDAGAPYCANLSTDSANCGACGEVCSGGLVCNNGSCAVSCPGNQVNCGGACVNPTNDPTHCGATTGCGIGDAGSAGTACVSGEVCNASQCSTSCPGSEVNCGGTCIDPKSDPTHCGAVAGCGVSDAGSAGTTCSSGEVCNAGSCSISCPGSEVNCGGTCIDPLSDLTHCGATTGCGLDDAGTSGTTCMSGEVCNAGSCSISCPGTEVNCNGVCIDPTSDPAHCGATLGCGLGDAGSSGTTCPNGEVCNAGSCSISCPGTEVNCNGVCVTPSTDPNHCGATVGCGLDDAGGSPGAACQAGEVCNAGSCSISCPGTEVNCNGVCVTPTTDPNHCGATPGCGLDDAGGSPGTACPSGEVCNEGTCSISCPGTEVNCNGVCVTSTTDPTHCGATNGCGIGGVGSAGTACPSGEVCNEGACSVSCPGSEVNCNGVCIAPNSDPNHCGATAGCGLNDAGTSGSACPSGEVCNSGSCSVSCPGSEVNCNGVCIAPGSDPNQCGATIGCGISGIGSAGSACPSGEVCNTGTCSVSCPGLEVNCNGVCIAPSSDPNHCGATTGCGVAGAGSAGTTCPSGEVCNTGTCSVSCPGSEVNCNGVCVTPSTDPTHCGATTGCGIGGVGSAGKTCPSGEVCNAGACSVSCPGSEVNCNGVCITPTSDPTYCGATTGCGVAGAGSAGKTCPSGQVCNSGTCSVSCPGTEVNCNGVCVTPTTDPTYCGATAGCGVAGAGSAGATCPSGEVCNAGICSVSCPGTEVNCNGVCVTPTTDPTHCGATTGCGVTGGSAGKTCANGQVCNSGTCSVSCPGSEVNCNGVCVTPTTDPTYCGATTGCGVSGGSAGKTCANGQVCNSGTCSVSCPGTEVNCNGVCVTPTTDPTYCGATTGCGVSGGIAGTTCANGQVCNSGTCSVSCPGTEVNCNGVCVTPTTDPTHCGATTGCGVSGGSAGTTCANGQVCNSGSCSVSCPGSEVNCNGVCVTPTTDPTHCGATTGCGVSGGSAGTSCASGQVCNSGTCSVSCPGSEVNCNGVCVTPTTDPTYCGATSGCGVSGGSAGKTCATGQVCNSGTCSVSCPGSEVNCNGVCVTPTTDPTHCGATTGCGVSGGSAGTTCASGQVCNSGTCSVSCPGSEVNCNGVCVTPSTDPTHCGATTGCGVTGGSAGTSCANGQVCNSGTCSISCPGTEVNCNGVCVTPSTDPTHCGATTGCGVTGGSAGTSCANGQVCNSGSCSVSCPGTEVNCNGVCVTPSTDPTYCGATTGCGVTGGSAGKTCVSGQVCNSGTCSVSCPGTEVNCNGACVTPSTDPTHCGATTGCGVTGGSAGTTCASGQVCNSGTCSVSCPGTEVNCNGACIVPATDPTYCGATTGCGITGGGAGTTCPSGDNCVGGVCSVTCSSGLIACGGKCVDPTSNPNYCGASAGCGVTGGSAGTACSSGSACFSSACLSIIPTGVFANYDARVTSSITKDASGNVSQWNDVSGNGYTLVNNGTRPVYNASLINGHPGLDFSNAAGMITSGTPPLSASVTVFFVVQWRSPGSWGSLAHHGNRDSDWAMKQNGLSGSSNIVHWQTNNDNGTDQLTLSTNTNWVLTGRMDPTNGRYFSAYSTLTGLASTTGAGDGIAAGNKTMYVGKSDANEASNAYFGQILYYNRSLTNAEVSQVLSYLESSWSFGSTTCSLADEGGSNTGLASIALSCPPGQTMSAINYASYGTPSGSCASGSFSNGSCNASNSLSTVSTACLNQNSCSVAASNGVFGDPCGGTHKYLAAIATCSY